MGENAPPPPPPPLPLPPPLTTYPRPPVGVVVNDGDGDLRLCPSIGLAPGFGGYPPGTGLGQGLGPSSRATSPTMCLNKIGARGKSINCDGGGWRWWLDLVRKTLVVVKN